MADRSAAAALLRECQLALGQLPRGASPEPRERAGGVPRGAGEAAGAARSVPSLNHTFSCLPYFLLLADDHRETSGFWGIHGAGAAGRRAGRTHFVAVNCCQFSF